MNKQEVQFAVVTNGKEIVRIGHSVVLQPEIKFGGGAVKWFDDSQLYKKKTENES